MGNPEIKKIVENIKSGNVKYECFSLDDKGIVYFEGRIAVPDLPSLKDMILKAAHDTPHSIHPGSTKMYQDLKTMYWWTSMKREIAKYVSECDVCQRVKAVHQKSAGLLQPLKILSDEGIRHQYSAAYTPQQNGVAEMSHPNF